MKAVLTLLALIVSLMSGYATVTSPAAGHVWYPGDTVSINWDTNKISRNDLVSILLISASSPIDGPPGDGFWTWISYYELGNTGSFQWQVPEFLDNNGKRSSPGQYRIEIRSQTPYERLIGPNFQIKFCPTGGCISSVLVSKNLEVPDQNITANTTQPLGGYLVKSSRPIVVQSMVFGIITQVGAASISNIEAFTDDRVLAGPVDAIRIGMVTEGELWGVFFTDAATFTGNTAVMLRGKVAGFPSGKTLRTIAFPNLWVVTDPVSGASIATKGDQGETSWGQTMTVLGPSLVISEAVGAFTPIAGERQTPMGGFWLDATASGEDIRVMVVASDYEATVGRPTDIHNVGLYTVNTEGRYAPLTTGVNLANPSQNGPVKHTLDSTDFTVKRGTKQFVARLGNTSTRAAGGTYTFKTPSANHFVAVGLTTAQHADITVLPESGTTTIEPVVSGEVVFVYSARNKVISEGRYHQALSVDLDVSFVEAFQGSMITFGIKHKPMAPRPAWLEPVEQTLVPELIVNGAAAGMTPIVRHPQGHFTTTSWYLADKTLEGRTTLTLQLNETFEPSLLQTGDEIEVWIESVNPMTGLISGFRVHPEVAEMRHTIVIRKFPMFDICGDVNRDGEINHTDVSHLVDLIDAGFQAAQPHQDVYPDGRLNYRDVEQLHRYLRGELLTLPLGDVSYSWSLTTTDIAFTRRAILGIQPFRNFQGVQADISGDKVPTTLDITLMRRLILGLLVP